MKKALFVYNPKSGHRVIPARLDHVIKRFLAEDVILHPFRIGQNNDDRLRTLLAEEGYSFMLVSGGDGTLNHVVNNMFKCNVPLPIGIIASGTCNDLAKNLSISENLDKAIDIVLKGKTKSIDTGLINNEVYLVNTCAGGAFVNVSYNTSDELKKNIGQLAYYINGLGSLASIKPFRIRMQMDNEIINENIILFVILNGRHVAGFNNVSCQADMSDGLMDIIILRNCQPYELPVLFLRVLNNSLSQDKRVGIFKSSYCHIESESNIYLSVDGEKAAKLPITIRFIKKNLDVFVP